MYVALALFVTGATALAGSDDLLAAFACGTAFAWDDWFSESIEDSNFSNIIDLLINCATFMFIGATMPFAAWNDSALTLTPWRLAVLGICVLILRRLPVILALHRWIPDCHTLREATFMGHFGPMGVGAIFISTLAVERLPTPHYPPETSLDITALSIQPITYFLVLTSILVHGVSIPFFNLGRRVHSMSRTWTTGSGTGEPSWLSRVRKVGDPQEVEINRDTVEKDDATPSPDEREAMSEKVMADIESGLVAQNLVKGHDHHYGRSQRDEIPLEPSGSGSGSSSDERAERHDERAGDEEVWQEGEEVSGPV